MSFPTKSSANQLTIAEATVSVDHLVSPEEAVRIAQARQ